MMPDTRVISRIVGATLNTMDVTRKLMLLPDDHIHLKHTAAAIAADTWQLQCAP